jgi:hypothetical protein
MVSTMESRLSDGARQQFNRFVRQYLQLQLDLDYPDEEYLRNDAFQQSLHDQLFSENEIKKAPPARYQLRVLKELTRRIEQSIQDWDEEVCSFLQTKSSIYMAYVVHIHLGF